MRLHLLHALIQTTWTAETGRVRSSHATLCLAVLSQVQKLANDGFRDYHLRFALVSVAKYEAARSWTGQRNCGSPRKWQGMHSTVRL